MDVHKLSPGAKKLWYSRVDGAAYALHDNPKVSREHLDDMLSRLWETFLEEYPEGSEDRANALEIIKALQAAAKPPATVVQLRGTH